MADELPSVVGWYAVRIPRPDGSRLKRTAFLFPGEKSMMAELHESPPAVVDLSEPPFRFAEFTGPFPTEGEAETALESGGRRRA
jgi:hypothetical protein